jgi:hypothetical protein
MLAAIAHIMIDEPEDVERFEESIVIVVKFERGV